MLQLHSVTKRYGPLTALDGVSLEIARGEFFGLLGPNGAGKSTTMSLIAGLRTPDSGTLTLDGEPLTPANVSARAALGLVPQNIALYDDLSADQNLRIFGQLYGLRGAELRARIDEALEAVQLADRRRDTLRGDLADLEERPRSGPRISTRQKMPIAAEQRRRFRRELGGNRHGTTNRLIYIG